MNPVISADAGRQAEGMTRCRPGLGTFVEIRIRAPGPTAADDIDAGFAAIEHVEALMSFHRPGSELARLNRAAAGDALQLHAWTVEVLALAVDLHGATAGLFDCAIGVELIESGLLPGDRSARSSPSLAATPRRGFDAAPPAHGSGSITDVEILDATHVRLRRPVCIDLGGIAKGYAVDRSIEVLRARGVSQASVNAGGDLRVLGAEAETIRLRSPTDPARAVEIGRLADGAIATSSVSHSGGHHAGRWRSALIDPRSRQPVADRRSFSVLAERCAVADGLTKALAVAGSLPADCLARYGATALVL